MRAARVGLVVATMLPVAAACASFGATGTDTPPGPDAATNDALALPDVETTPGDDAAAADVCATVDDDFDRGPPRGGPWQDMLVDDGNQSSATIVNDPVAGKILQTNAVPNGSTPSFAVLRTTLHVVPKSMTCTFDFRPDTSFVTGAEPDKSPGLDVLLVAVVHSDESKTLLRFSYKDGTIELRDDFVDETDDCIDACPEEDSAKAAPGMAKDHWSTMQITTDFSTVTFTATTDGAIDTITKTFANVGERSALQLYLGVVNFGNDTQLGSYDHFHCELHC